MAAFPVPETPMTAEEYLAFERASDEKHEYLDGETFAMSGAKMAHNLVTANVIALLHGALRLRPCLVFPSDMKVHIPSNGLYAYPDITVVCGKPQFQDEGEDVLLNPTVIVEVLSDSTESYDRGDKFGSYQTIPSLQDYVLISPKKERIEVFSRRPEGWLLRTYGPGDCATLESIEAELAIEETYLKVFA
jgi:Uma2 family endonuclease